VLTHTPKEARANKVSALIFVGDAMEEKVDELRRLAGELGILGAPVFVFTRTATKSPAVPSARSPSSAAAPTARGREGARMNDKIKPHHLGRKAILCVRQSSAHPDMGRGSALLPEWAPAPRRGPHSPLPTSTPRSLRIAWRRDDWIGVQFSTLSRDLSIWSCKRPNFTIGQRDRYVEEGVRARQEGSVEHPTKLHWR
jgi:hypothetical protein